jgi:hypothetical protein
MVNSNGISENTPRIGFERPETAENKRKTRVKGRPAGSRVAKAKKRQMLQTG